MIAEILIFLLTLLFTYFLFVYKKNHQRFSNAGIKYLPGWPVLGNNYKSMCLKQHIHFDLVDVYSAFPNEKYVGFVEGISPIILIRDPELIKQITVKDFEHFTDHRAFMNDDLFSNSLFLMKGEKWRDMRTTLSPAFTGSKMRLMVPFIVDISKNIVNYLKERTHEDQEMDTVIRRYTNDVIASTAFGLTIDSLKNPDNKFYTMGQSIVNFNFWQRVKLMISSMCPAAGQYLEVFPKEHTDFFKDMIKTTMRHREEHHIERPDMVQLLMEANKGTLKATSNGDKDSIGFATTEDIKIKSASEVRKWTQDEIAAQAFIFFFAGFESSASALVMAIHELTLNPEVQTKLYQEIRSNWEKHGQLSYEAIQELKYMDGVISETLRKWSPALALDRVCLKDYTLPPPHQGGKPVKLNAKDVVYNVVNAMHMDEQYYPNPKKFDPERFSDDNKVNIKPFTYIPFGVGPRNCIGSRFALLELKILLFYLLLDFQLLKTAKTIDPIKLGAEGFNMRCKGGTWVKLELRKETL